ncbi:unnamed protein product [Anisakis simplex]|uniref:WH2 domain-containing protein n=1 Tax=Anisakis simplex TaxID=6269 RepID=A0A0M3KI45_ANISI|nr:unnamed protein product [Anisakis simplex]
MRQDYASASTSHILPSLYPSLILKGAGTGAGGPIGRGYHQHPERSIPIRPPPPYSAVSHDHRSVGAVRQPLTPRDDSVDLQKRLDKLKEERAFLEQAVSSHDPRGVDAVRQPLAPRDDPAAMQKRLDKLKEERAFLEQGSVKPAASVTEIEERLAALRGVSVEEIRHPSLVRADYCHCWFISLRSN